MAFIFVSNVWIDLYHRHVKFQYAIYHGSRDIWQLSLFLGWPSYIMNLINDRCCVRLFWLTIVSRYHNGHAHAIGHHSSNNSVSTWMKHPPLSLHTVNRDGTWRRLTKSYQIFGIQRDFYLDVYTILNRIEFEMDHMRILGTEPSSVIFSEAK